MRYLYDLTLADWQEWARENQLPPYRATQIHQWVSRGIESTSEMTNLSRELRALLDGQFIVSGLQLERKLVSALDGTTKYVFRLHDGNVIESVLMRYHYGLSVCLSSQAGCRMGCTFCASADAGFGRSLSHGEMLAQVARIARDCGERIGHAVVMGIGEPFDNYDNLIRFLRLVNDPSGLNIGMRHISVSTCGLVPEMIKFTDEGLPVTLSVSLHAPNDPIRRQLMPIARRHDLGQLLAACRRHTERTGRRISFEYSLFSGVNDRPEHAAELAARLKGMLCHVNLIAANEFPGGAYRQSSPADVQAFLERLTRAGINATVRRQLGADIMAACGQLRRNSEACGNP
ncbi:MAG TPA: 23S rRNA (adenine(2503)-C(2))-methyltransferase RlmN [Clostridiales bacterium]|nr:23S rRNA (adenine(2503)-C(2))-methyltransferase RlmN [Clostridiales bacterium]